MSASFSQEKYDFLKNTREYALLEKDEANFGKALEQVASYLGRIVHGQKLCGQNEGESSLRIKEPRGVNHERSPRACEPCESNALSKGCLLSPGLR